MKVLIDKDNVLIKVCDDFDEGITGGIIKINGVPYEATVVEIAEVPENFEIGEYIYESGNIVPNPDWHSEDESLETQVSELQETLEDLLTNVLPMLMGE